MKIMHLIHGLSVGGAETIVKEYALKIDKNKFDIVILCFDRFGNSPYEKILEDNNIRVIYISDYMKYYHKKGFFYKVINYLQRYYLIKKIIHEENLDILHTHLTLNSYVKYANVNNNCKIFHTVHSEPEKLWNNSKSGKKDFKCAKYLVKHKNMKMIALHEEMRKTVNKMFDVNDTIILNNGIDFSKFDNIKNSREKIRKMIGIPQNAYVVGHVGRFNHVKNHIFLIDVFNEVCKYNKNALLLLIGSGQDEQKIINKLNEYNLIGKTLILSNRNDVPELLKAMDVFVFPSKYEGLSITLIEAQKAKLPCFISDTISTSTIISNLITIIPLNNNSNQWAQTITNYKYPSKVILHDEDWNMNKIVKKLEKIYLKSK